MIFNNLPLIPDSYLKDNSNNRYRPYRTRNLFIQETSPDIITPTETRIIPGDVPAIPAKPGTIPEKAPANVGYISVGVFTASGALPVKDSVVTVYGIDDDGEENAIYNVVSDASGQIPLLTLPVVYNPLNPLVSPEFYFSTYNLRVQAINYYTFNLLDIRIFPDTTTAFSVDLIPVAAGSEGASPYKTKVIPPSQIDYSND